jgi:hypothetical protein
MRPSVTPILVAASLAALVFGTTPSSIRPDDTRASSTSTELAEIARIRSHFDSVLVDLRSRDVSQLANSQRESRLELLSTLAAYRDRGLFPRNYDFPGQAVPYFVDRKTGVLCAVAHLLESTGRRDIVDRVAAWGNNVWVPQLRGDTAFTSWLDRHGLTLAEAARIQVPYESGSPITAYGVGSTATVLLSSGAAVWNATTNRDAKMPFVSFLGLLSGATSMSLSIGGANNSDVPGWLNAVNFGAGAASLLSSTGSLMKRQRLAAAKREAEHKRAEVGRGGVRVDVSPTLAMTGRKAAGVALHIAF